MLAELLNKRSNLKKVQKSEKIEIQPRIFDIDSGAWISGNAQSEFSGDSLIILSFNIMKEAHSLGPRMEALLRIIRDYHPDIILFQENTRKHDKMFLADSFIQENYVISDFTGQENGFKVSVYSRYMVGEMTCLDCVGRPAILMSLPQASVGIICVHLTSGNNSSKRRKQFEYAYEQLACFDHGFVIGDCNARNDSEDTESINQRGFEDAALSLDVLDPTFPSHRPVMRLDRVAYRSDVWQPTSLHIIGQEVEYRISDWPYFISDHLGIVVTFQS